MGSIEEQALLKLIPLEGPIEMKEETPSLKSFLDKAAGLLCFEASTDDKGGSIVIHQKGSVDWLECLDDDNEKIRKDGFIKCQSLSELKTALGFIKVLVKMKGSLNMDARDYLNTSYLASAIVMILTIGKKLQVCGKYVRWCKPESRRKDAFILNDPVCIKEGIDVSSSFDDGEISLSLKIDRGTRLNLFNPLLVSEMTENDKRICGGEVVIRYGGGGPIRSKMICGGKAVLCYLADGRIDEFNSKWNLSYSTGPDPPKYWKSEDCFFLH